MSAFSAQIKIEIEKAVWVLFAKKRRKNRSKVISSFRHKDRIRRVQATLDRGLVVNSCTIVESTGHCIKPLCGSTLHLAMG